MRAWLVAIVVALAAPSASAADIRVMAAGSLKDVFTAIFADYTKQHPGAFDTLSKKAQQVFGGAATTTPMNAPPRLLTALDDHSVDLIINYCSSARQMVRDQLKYKSVELPPELLVGAEYELTVSRNAAPGAADFAMYLLSPQGHASLKTFGFIPVALPVVK
jgi:molybdate transport system substrate-binding protein